MFRFFKLKKWFVWSWLGSLIILSSLWVQVKIDVKINEWFGVFYDMIQKALASPNAITIEEYWSSLASFITLAGMYIALYVAISFFTAHYLFRWRTAMVEWYHSVYDKAGKIEGASQRAIYMPANVINEAKLDQYSSIVIALVEARAFCIMS